MPKIADFAHFKPRIYFKKRISPHIQFAEKCWAYGDVFLWEYEVRLLGCPRRDTRFYKFSPLRAHPPAIHFLAKEN